MPPPTAIRDAKVEGFLLRLARDRQVFIGLIFKDGAERLRIEGADGDDVWRRLHDEVARLNPMYFGFDGALARFLKFFPDGFHPKPGTPSERDYDRQERDYKVEAKRMLDSAVPLEKAATGSGFGEAILAVFRKTNLLSPFEKTRLQDVLRRSAADPFIRAAARFTLGEVKTALLEMEAALKPHDSAKWTVVTYLPFLWRPEEHMFLKPEASKDFAQRVGHRFAHDYESRLDISVYEGLLDLASRTEFELAELDPRDRIDVHSFIWVVGNYKEKGAPTPNA
jgi:hypothetical protein